MPIKDAHLLAGAVLDVATSADGLLVCTIGADQFIKVFDVINFGVWAKVSFLL